MELSSNWNAEDSFDYSHVAVPYQDAIPVSLSELLSMETCFILNKKSGESSNCSLRLSCDSFNCIDGSFSSSNNYKSIESVCIVSESKLIEVFGGEHDAYIGSFPGTVMESFSDSQLCKTDIDLKTPQTTVKFILKKTFEESSVMIYGIHVKTLLNNCMDLSKSKYSSNKLDSLLSSHDVKLTKEAEMFKHVLQNYNDNNSNNGALDSISKFMPLLSSMDPSLIPLMLSNKSHLMLASAKQSFTANACESNNNLCTTLGSMDISPSTAPEAAVSGATALSSPAIHSFSNIKLEDCDSNNISAMNITSMFESVIDKKMTQFEAKMEQIIDTKLSNLSSKILDKLDNIEKHSHCKCQLSS